MTSPYILPFHGTHPTIGLPLVYAGARAAVLGRATLGAGASLGEDCVVRADGQIVRIGAGAWLGRRATIHIVHDILPAIIGTNVTVGTNSVVHACTVGDNCVFEDDVTILDGASIEDNVLVEAGSTVFPRKLLPSGFAYGGSPAKPLRPLRKGELAEKATTLRARHTSVAALPGDGRDFGAAVFIAHTTQRAGTLKFGPGSSLFFSCIADAGSGAISVGDNTNIQDNTILRAGSGEIVIGHHTTIGHNVRMTAARIGDKALVGIGTVLGEGTVVQDDVLLAAGATTDPGQVLESGWMWGGRPAKPLSRLDDARRKGMAQNIANYCGYSQTFRRLQDESSAAQSRDVHHAAS